MVIGVGLIDILIPDSHSLKEKGAFCGGFSSARRMN